MLLCEIWEQILTNFAVQHLEVFEFYRGLRASNGGLTDEQHASTVDSTLTVGIADFLSSIMALHCAALNKQTAHRFLFFIFEIFIWLYCIHCSNAGLFLQKLLFFTAIYIYCLNVSSMYNDFSPGFYDLIPNVTLGFQRSRLIFVRSWVLVSAWRPAVQCDEFHPG